MPSWKRIIVSGSNAELGSIYATGAVTASIVSASTVIGTTGRFNNLQVSGSTVMSGSGVLLQLIGSGSTIFSISGSGGEIFKIADDASTTSLFTVSSASINVLDIDSSKNVRISGSLIVTGSITGSLFGTASWAYSSSQALTASYGNITGSLFGTASWAYSASQALTASYGNITGSLYGTASWAYSSSQALTASYGNITGSLFGTASWAYSASQALTASYGNITGSLFGTASWAYSSSQALTASYVNLLAGPNITINYQTNGIAITGSGGGTPGGANKTIQFNDSTAFSGSNNFTFDKSTNEVQLTGSLTVSGSGTFTNIGPAVFTGSFVVVDTTGELAIEITNGSRTLYDASGILSIENKFRRAFDSSTTQSIDWESRVLAIDDGAGNPLTTVDWSIGQLVSINASRSIDWDTRIAFYPTETQSIDWAGGRLYDQNQSSSIHWNTRGLYDVNQNTALVYTNVNASDGVRLYGTASYALTSSLAQNARSASFVSAIKTSDNATFYVTFIDSINSTFTDYEQLYTGASDASAITYNPSTRTLTVTNITASLFGTASWASNVLTASQVQTQRTSSAAQFFPTFVDSNNTPAAAEIVYTTDNGSKGMYVIPDAANGTTFYSNIISSSVFFAATTAQTIGFIGTASWAQSSSQAATASYVTGSVFNSTNPALSASYALTASYALSGGGSGVVTTYTNGVDNRVITSTGAAGINGEVNMTFDGSTLAVTGNVTATSVTSSFTGSLVGNLFTPIATGIATYDPIQDAYYYSNGDYYYSSSVHYFGDPVEGANGFTGNLVGTSSWADYSVTASYVTASNVYGPHGGNSVLSSSYAVTASFVPTIKSGVANTFTGNPRTSTVTFTTPYANANYAVTVTGGTGVARSWTIDSKTTTGFTINSNATTPISGEVNWIAVPYNS